VRNAKVHNESSGKIVGTQTDFKHIVRVFVWTYSRDEGRTLGQAKNST